MFSLGFSLTSIPILQRGGSATSRILGAGGLDYADYRLTDFSRLWQDDAGTTPVDAYGQPIGRAVAFQKPGHMATQANNNYKPFAQSAGAKPDGIDDHLASGWLGQAGANCMIVRAQVLSSISGTQIFSGAQDAGGANKFWFGCGAVGQLLGGVGPQNGSVIFSAGVDVRNRDAVFALCFSGSVVKIYCDEAEVYSAAQAGQATTTTPQMIGCLNNGGFPVTYTSAYVNRIAFGKVFPTLEEFKSIRAEWLSA